MASLYSLDKLSFAYGTKKVLRELTISLERGKFYGLVGPNGSGKSTLLDLLMGSLNPESGSILFAGRKLKHYSRLHLARHLALVPQEFNINFDFTVGEVVMMGRHPHIPRFANPRQEDHRVVDLVMCDLEINHLKERFITQLSGGEKQRVIVARSLAQDTPVMILDEATSSLDIHHSIHIFKVVKQRTVDNNGTVIAAIHDLNFAAAYCDQIILLDQGRIIMAGTPQEVLTPKYLREVFGVSSQASYNDFAGAYQIAYQY